MFNRHIIEDSLTSLDRLRSKYLCLISCNKVSMFIRQSYVAIYFQALGTVHLGRKRVRGFMGLGKWTAVKLPTVISIVSAFLPHTQYKARANFGGGPKCIFQMLPLPNLGNRNWSQKQPLTVNPIPAVRQTTDSITSMNFLFKVVDCVLIATVLDT